MIVHQPKQVISISGGSGIETFSLSAGMLTHILLEPATSTTTFDWELISSDNMVMDGGSKKASQPRYAEERAYALRGNFSIQITNASVDEDITCKMTFIENYGN